MTVRCISLFLCGLALASGAVGQPNEKQEQLAEAFLRCAHFYSAAYEDAKRNRPEFFTPGHPFQKLPEAIRTMRITADVLVGESEAASINSRNLSKWSAVVEVASSRSETWKTLTASMTAECRRIAYENDAELGPKVEERLRQPETTK